MDFFNELYNDEEQINDFYNEFDNDNKYNINFDINDIIQTETETETETDTNIDSNTNISGIKRPRTHSISNTFTKKNNIIFKEKNRIRAKNNNIKTKLLKEKNELKIKKLKNENTILKQINNIPLRTPVIDKDIKNRREQNKIHARTSR